MSFLKGLADLGMLLSAQEPANPSIAGAAPKLSKTGGNDAFFCPLLGPVMKGNEHTMLTKNLKFNTPVFIGLETKDSYEFILHCYESMHKLGIFHQHGVEFVSFQL